MNNTIFAMLCVFIGVVIGWIARYFNASPLVQSLSVSIIVAVVMFIFFQMKGGVK